MSFEALGWAVTQTARDDLDSSTTFVMFILANRADPEGRCYPSIRYITRLTKLSESTVRRACRQLVDNGMLHITRQLRDDGTQTSNHYRLCLPTPPPVMVTPSPLHSDTPTLALGQGDPSTVTPHKTKGLDERSKTQTLFADANGAWDKFWTSYPRKTAKQVAMKAWKRVKATELPALMVALEAHKQTDQWLRGVIPHPATWLHQRRWEDETTAGADLGLGRCMFNLNSDHPGHTRCDKPAVDIQGTPPIGYCREHQHLHRARTR